MSSQIKAVFTDLDGTLLGPDHKVSNYTRDVLNKLHERKIPLVVATGRPYLAAWNNIKDSGIQPDYFICTNGGRILDKDHKVIKCHDIDPSLVESLVKLEVQPMSDGTINNSCGAKKFSANFYADNTWYTDNRKAVKFVEETLFGNCLVPEEVNYQKCSPDLFKSVHQIFFLASEENIPGIKTYVERTYGDQILVMLSHPCVFDVVPRNIDKSIAVKEVCSLLGCTVEEVVAFGDSMNDRTMLEAVSSSFIMSNALPVLREALPGKQVIGSNEEDGVAHKLEELFNL